MSDLDIRNIDCLELLGGISDNSIDHINCDPPYNIGYDGGDSWDRFPSEQTYLIWCYRWIAECARVIKPRRMICIWGTLKNDTFLRLKLDILNKIEELYNQNSIHWSYNWGGRSKLNFPHKFETAWCYSKGKEFYFDDSHIKVKRKMTKNIRTGKEYTNDTIPTTIWEGNLATVSSEAQESKFHPTVKPQFVLERMISAYTKEGDIVLDLFSGSGSTAVACFNTGRKFIGSEIREDYYQKSLERIEKHTKFYQHDSLWSA